MFRSIPRVLVGLGLLGTIFTSTSGTNTGDVTLTALGSSPSANGASLSGQALTLQPADSTHPGLVKGDGSSQTFNVTPTFTGTVTSNNYVIGTGPVVHLNGNDDIRLTVNSTGNGDVDTTNSGNANENLRLNVAGSGIVAISKSGTNKVTFDPTNQKMSFAGGSFLQDNGSGALTVSGATTYTGSAVKLTANTTSLCLDTSCTVNAIEDGSGNFQVTNGTGAFKITGSGALQMSGGGNVELTSSGALWFDSSANTYMQELNSSTVQLHANLVPQSDGSSGLGTTSQAWGFNWGYSWGFKKHSLDTCNSGAEGEMEQDTTAGGTSGHRTRICVCTSNGAGTPTYAWQNVVSGTVGNTTTCSD